MVDMPVSARRPPLRRWVASTATAFLMLAPSSPVEPAVEQKEVLVLYTSRRDAEIAIVGDREIPRILEAGLPEGIDYYSEYIDRARFPSPEYQRAFHDFLQLKYSGRRFDVVVAMNDLALEFVENNRTDLFADTPAIFFSEGATSRRIANSTGVRSGLNLGDTIELALTLQPDTRNLFVVSGADSGDEQYARIAREQLARFEQRVAITYLSGLTATQLETELATLPGQSLVYYLLVLRDGAGNDFHPLRFLDRLTGYANAPTYCWVQSAIGHGIVGGRLKDQQAEAAAVAGLTLRVLRGESADAIPIAHEDLNVRQVDWRELRRWGISESNVPPGTQVLFREPSVWDRYRFQIVGALVLLAFQTALVAALFVQLARRRQAEAKVRKREAELRSSYERIRDLGGRLLDAQEVERARIARELHDDVSQQAALLAIDLDLLQRSGDEELDTIVELTRDACDRAQKIASSLHDLSHRLHPAKLQLMGLLPALDGLRRDFSHPGVEISFTHDGVPATLAPDLTLCLFRIVQEALANAVKHSEASEVRMHLHVAGDTLTLSITDDGVGFDVDAAWGSGLGLISMRERLESVGGTVAIQSTPGAGTRLHVTVPGVTALAPELSI
jgi:signal transduction histidine kinase